jgi:hypothetical protein
MNDRPSGFMRLFDTSANGMAPHALEDPVQVTTSPETLQPLSNGESKSFVAIRGSEPDKAPLRTIFPYLELEDHPIDEYPSIKVIVVGAGPAGITAGALLTHKVPGLEIVIYERYNDVVSIYFCGTKLVSGLTMTSPRVEYGTPTSTLG